MENSTAANRVTLDVETIFQMLDKSHRMILLNSAIIELVDKKPRITCTCLKYRVFRTENILQTAIQACLALGIHLFGKEKSVAQVVGIDGAKFAEMPPSCQPIDLVAKAVFCTKENDSNRNWEKFIFHFEAVVEDENGKHLASARISIAISTAKDRTKTDTAVQGKAVFPLTPDQISEGMGKVVAANAPAIMQALKDGPRPGDLGCE